MHEAMHPLFVQMSSEVERSLSSLAKLFPDRVSGIDSTSFSAGRIVERLYLVGGARQLTDCCAI